VVEKREGERSFWREHAVALTVSIALHVLLAAALVYGWWQWHTRPKPVQPLPIQATVVDETAIRRETAKLEAAEQQKRAAEQAAAEQAQKLKQEAEDEAKKLEELKQQREAEEQAERAEAERKQKEAAEAAAKAEAAARLAVENKRKATEAKQRAAREAELKRQLEAEERRQAAISSGELANYIAQIQARIQRAWNRPPSATAGIDCTVYITQVPGGTVASARLGDCNGDDAVRESILAAVYRASPLPAPSNPDLFDRNLKVPFRPDQ
jgi:colicin import membrane protein